MVIVLGVYDFEHYRGYSLFYKSRSRGNIRRSRSYKHIFFDLGYCTVKYKEFYKMNIRDIIKNEYAHELNFNDKCAYCEKPWHKRKISWFWGGIRLTLDYLADSDYYDFKETMYFSSNNPKYNCLSKIFIYNGPITNKYRISNFNKGCRKLYSFGRGLHDE